MNFGFENLYGTEKLKRALVASILIKRKIAEPLVDGFQIPDLLPIYDDSQDIIIKFLALKAEESTEVLDHVAS